MVRIACQNSVCGGVGTSLQATEVFDVSVQFDSSPPHAARAVNRAAHRATGYRIWLKRALDVGLVLVALPVVLPLMGLIALALWIEGGQPFYTQARLGQHGRKFRVLKFRTMVRDAEHMLQRLLDEDPALRREWDRTQKLRHDPRITPIGHFLRRSSLDELPQLFNVLRGEMSLVGPRPMMPEQLELYGPYAPSYFALRPGLTGLWQVSERNSAHFLRRAELDAQYERMVSFSRDLALLLATFRVVWRGTGY